MDNTLISHSTISSLIHTIRGKQVMLDSDLAVLYQVETKVFNQAVKRNLERFTEAFRFQLTKSEWEILRSQFVTLKDDENNSGRGKHRKYLPYAFTEQDITTFNAQYPTLDYQYNNDFHDRFLILDEQNTFHIGASLKDLGKKSFAITYIEDPKITLALMDRIRKQEKL